MVRLRGRDAGSTSSWVLSPFLHCSLSSDWGPAICSRCLSVGHLKPGSSPSNRIRRPHRPLVPAGSVRNGSGTAVSSVWLVLISPERMRPGACFLRHPPISSYSSTPSLTSRGSESALHAAQVAKRIVFGAKANANARRQFAPRYLTNTIRNASALVAGSDIRALRDAYRGIPAVITAAGPSLDNALDPLRDLRDRGLLIACDTTLRPLIANGVTPQLVVGADPGERNARHFQAVGDCHDTWLVAESALDPSVAPRFGNRSFWFRVADHHPWPWYRELGIDVGTVEVWGSVLTAAFQVAILAGCDPIVLVGADFSWTDGRPYARGTTYEFDWAYSAAIGNDLRDAWQQTSSGTTMTRGPTRPRDSHDSSPASLSGLDAHTGGSKRPSRDQRERGRHLLRQRRQAIIPWQGPQ